MKWSKLQKVMSGSLMVELLVTLGISAIFFPALMAGLLATRDGRAQQEQRFVALSIIKESTEAVRVIREKGWSFVATNGTYHPVSTGTTWGLANGAESSNGFTHSITLEDAYRDVTGSIVESGGTVDPSTKKVIYTVSWTTPQTSSVSTIGYISRYLDNLSYSETTSAQFNAGIKTGVTVTTTDDGEVILGAGGLGQWCTPDLTLTTADLPKSGVANAITAIEGYVFAGTGDNASGESYVKVGLSSTNPPTASRLGTFSNYKTNDVFGEADYGYIATDTNSREVSIISITATPYTEIGYFDAPGSSDGESIFISGTTGYMTSGNKLYAFNLTSKNGSRPVYDSDGVTLAGTGTAVVVVGTYAYVALSGSTEMQIIDVSNPSTLTVVGQANVAGSGGIDLFVNSTGTRVYLATGASASQAEFFIVDTSGKTGNRPVIGSFDTDGMDPQAVTVVPGNRGIIVGRNAEEYQVVNLANEANLVQCGGLNVDSGINDIASVLESDGDAYSYIITGDVASELKIIEGGPGGEYSTIGTFESQSFDAGVETAFNRIIINANAPAQTEIMLQVAITDAVNGTCSEASYVFVGPDNTSATFYTSSGVLPFDNNGAGYENPGRCARYKAYMETSDQSSTPELLDVAFNYSP